MMNNGKEMEWRHIQDLYEKVTNTAIASNGISLLPKLKQEHVNLTSYSRMRVDLATQVLSKSVADALAYFGDPRTEETEKFIRHFDKFFDCLNVRSFSEWKPSRKPDRKPYTSPDDPRLEWLEKDFLGYLSLWEDHVSSIPGLKPARRQAMTLSRETIEGLKMTVHSFVDLTKYILTKQCGENLFILSERFSQDPLENYFGKQRARGGRSDNPTVQRSLHNLGTLRVQKSMALDPVRGNSRRKRRLFEHKDEITLDDIDNTPLPKRKRQSHKQK